MRGSAIAVAVGAAIAGFVVADVLGHPNGTKQAGGVLTSLWRTTAQGVSGQKITS